MQRPCSNVHSVSANRETIFDQLPPKAQAKWRAWSAKGGRSASKADKVRAAKIGWSNSPNRFEKRKRRHKTATPAEPIPTGFFCECGKWHNYPEDMQWRGKLEHTCACHRQHIIRKGIATLIT